MINQIKFPLSDLQVVIGPATSNSYEINDEIKEKFETLPIDSQCYIETRGTNRHGIDLKKPMHYYYNLWEYLKIIFILHNMQRLKI